MTPPLSPVDWQWVLHAWVYLTCGEVHGELPVYAPTFDAQVEMVARGVIVDLHPGFTGQSASCYHQIYRHYCGSPPFNHSLTFPGVEALAGQIAFGEAHLAWLEGQKKVYPLDPHPWDERIADMHWRLSVYKWAKEVASDRDIALRALSRWPRDPGAINTHAYYVGWARSEMRTLEGLIGPDVYLGVLPPVVPSHTFRRIP